MKKCNNGIIGCLLNVIKYLVNCGNPCCKDKESGSLTLAYGQHEVNVNTSVQPSNVFLSIKCQDTPVCMGNMTMVGYSIQPTGFILYADIKTNTCEICWCIEGE